MQKLVFPLLLLALAALPTLAAWQGLIVVPDGTLIRSALHISLWLASAFLLARTAHLSVHHTFRRRLNRVPPRLLVDLITGVIWLITLSIMSVVELGVSPSAALATSGVLIAVIGFAVRSLLADLFYGLTMAVERPFEIGDWVKLSDTTVGRVDEMTWRAVELVTSDNLKVVVPNSKLAMEQIVNFDQPQPYWRRRQVVTLGHDVSPGEVQRMLTSAIEQVAESATIPREPDARIVSWDERGVDWELRYWLPDYFTSAEVGQRVHEAFLNNMRFAGIRVPRRREEVFVAELNAERNAEHAVADQWIDHVDLFAPVPEKERLALQERAYTQELTRGDLVVRQGEAGSSLFVIQRGAFEVLIETPQGGSERVGTMGSGAVFGELSLLTGAPRSATVRALTDGLVHEITKDSLTSLLERNADLARQLATILAERQMADEQRDASTSPSQLESDRRGRIATLMDNARTFLRIPV